MQPGIHGKDIYGMFTNHQTVSYVLTLHVK